MIITLAWEQIPIFSLCYEATWDKNNYKILFRSTESLDALVKTENFQMEISVYSSILSTYYFWTMRHVNMHKNYKSVKCKVDLRISTFVWGERRSETLTGTWRKKKKGNSRNMPIFTSVLLCWLPATSNSDPLPLCRFPKLKQISFSFSRGVEYDFVNFYTFFPT